MMILQPGDPGAIAGRYLPAEASNLYWGRLPVADAAPAMKIESGEVVTIDTLSHEGLMEDQGRDPLAYFSSHGVAEEDVLVDMIDLARSPTAHTFGIDGPHVVTGPIHIDGARPGDILKVEYLNLQPRVPYGVISTRHGLGALPDEYPQAGPDGSPQAIQSQFCRADIETGTGIIDLGNGREIRFDLDPFIGLSGVTADTADALSTVPPGRHGGNLDVKDLGIGSALYLPIQVEGAGYYMGDPHFAQGNGEVALTALEASLRATVRLTVLTRQEASVDVGFVDGPCGSTAEYWIGIGLDRDLNLAMKKAVREAIRILHEVAQVPPSVAYLYLSAAADFVVSQVVDDVKGVHCRIKKADFAPWH